MKLSIFGLGYVGTVSACCFARSGHTVIGVDSNPLKVDAINRKESPIVEPMLAEALKTVVEEGRFRATTDPVDAVMQTDMSLVCVGTPSNPNRSANLTYLRSVSREIASALKIKSGYHAIVVRSTIFPGTTGQVVSILESVSGKKLGRDFGVAFNPEFLREGSSMADFEHPPFTIVGASEERVVEMMKELYAGTNAPFHSVGIREAEFLKYACNAFHAVKITFANEIGAICKGLDIDSHAIMKIFCEDTRLNISPAYLKPGFAFGGSCLPKDLRAITYEAQRLDLQSPLLDSLLVSNEMQIERTIQWIVELNRKKIGILGLSFKNNTDDLRGSPLVKVVETLLGKGYQVEIYDPNVNLSRLLGSNKTFIEKEIPHLARHMKSGMQEVVDGAEIILIANANPEFAGALKAIRPDQIVLDLVRITQDPAVEKGRYEGIYW